MSDLAAYAGNKLLGWIAGSAMGTAPTTVYASLWNGDPASAGVEVTGTVGLTRQAITWGSVSARAMSSSADLAFGTASGSASVTYVAIHDASTAGNEICEHNISTASITSGLVVKILSGTLTLTF